MAQSAISPRFLQVHDEIVLQRLVTVSPQPLSQDFQIGLVDDAVFQGKRFHDPADIVRTVVLEDGGVFGLKHAGGKAC